MGAGGEGLLEQSHSSDMTDGCPQTVGSRPMSRSKPAAALRVAKDQLIQPENAEGGSRDETESPAGGKWNKVGRKSNSVKFFVTDQDKSTKE